MFCARRLIAFALGTSLCAVQPKLSASAPETTPEMVTFPAVSILLDHQNVVVYQEQAGNHLGMTDQFAVAPLPYSGDVGTDVQKSTGFELPLGRRRWAFIQKQASPALFLFAATERDAPLQYRVTFSVSIPHRHTSLPAAAALLIYSIARQSQYSCF